MEAERRSTMSSLKGQLSNVEGSVKSMKVAVVVGSVLTVACLAAVFGVTVLANEVSKEVKVSNGALTSKSGNSVVTSTLVPSTKVSPSSKFVEVYTNAGGVSVAVNSVVSKEEQTVVIGDECMVVVEGGATELIVNDNTLLATVFGSAERSVQGKSWWAKQIPVVGAALGGVLDGAQELGEELMRCAFDLVEKGVCWINFANN